MIASISRPGRIRLEGGAIQADAFTTTRRVVINCLWRVYASAGGAFEVFLAHRLLPVGVDRMQRNFEPMRKQVESWQRSELTDVTAKVVIYEAFVEGQLEAPKHLAQPSTTCISNRSTRNSGREQSGVCRMLSSQPSRSSTQFHNLGRRRSSESFWKLGFRSRSSGA